MGTTAFSIAGAQTLLLSVNPSFPGRTVISGGRAVGQTSGGERYSYAKGAAQMLHTLRFEGLAQADLDGGYDYAAGTQAAGTQSLVNWFLNVAPPGVEFTYTDPFGAAHAVSFEDTELELTLTDHGLYACAVRLREKLVRP